MTGATQAFGPILLAASHMPVGLKWFQQRYLDVVGSIYIYNEHRGYNAIDRVLDAVRRRAPGDHGLIEAIRKHRADERKHYLMFKRWFELRGQMPLAIGRTCGHIDRFVELVFGRRIDALDTNAVVASDIMFERLCQVIALTERRGYRQIETLLKSPLVRSDRTLMRIFEIIRKDEPDHWSPYEGWLDAHRKRHGLWWERLVDSFIHMELLLIKLPILFFSLGMRRRSDWPDAAEAAIGKADVQADV
jgi:hypothetical protein